MKVKIGHIGCRTILSKSRLYSIDYSINPYKGCTHNCVYCFARAMYERYGGDQQWGTFVDVKTNAPSVLAKQIRRKTEGTVLVSSITDPYQKIEKKYELTRKLLLILSKRPLKVFILTKSGLVTRDIDIFEENPDWEVGITLTTLEDSVRELIEPSAGSVEERIEALRTLIDAGIRTYAFIGPIIPFVTEKTLIELLNELQTIGVQNVTIDRLNIRGQSTNRLIASLEDTIDDIKTLRSVLKRDSPYFYDLKTQVSRECDIRGIVPTFCY